MGITAVATEQLGELVYVELPKPGARYKQGETCAVIESTKAASDVYAPLSGEVIAVNGALSDAPEQVNAAPYGDGWLFTGDLLDHGRLPVLSLLLAAGATCAIVTRARLALLALGLFGLWLVLYFGRPTLGPLIDLLPLDDGLFLHRLLGGVDIFGVGAGKYGCHCQ